MLTLATLRLLELDITHKLYRRVETHEIEESRKSSHDEELTILNKAQIIEETRWIEEERGEIRSHNVSVIEIDYSTQGIKSILLTLSPAPSTSQTNDRERQDAALNPSRGSPPAA